MRIDLQPNRARSPYGEPCLDGTCGDIAFDNVKYDMRGRTQNIDSAGTRPPRLGWAKELQPLYYAVYIA